MPDLSWPALIVGGVAALRALGAAALVPPVGAPPETPWRRGTSERRRRAGLRLAAECRDELRILTDGLQTGSLTPDEWAQTAYRVALQYLARGAALGYGGAAAAQDPAVLAQLDRLAQQVSVRAEALAGLVSAGERTPRQAGAVLAQAAGGRVHAAAQAGGVAWIGDEPVRWVMRDGADHCQTCPRVARTYASLEALLEETGGLPGEAETECFGNCQCSVEPASEWSTRADTRDLLVRRGGVAGLPLPAAA